MSDRSHLAAPARFGAVFVTSIFTSAFLLFLIQPVIARLLLPRYGGTPGVWNTSLVFFQAMLLLGYIYAHAGLRLLGERRFIALHAVLLLTSLLLLPPSLARAPMPSASTWPVRDLIISLAISVAIPFFVLSTNSPLIQHWFSLSRAKVGQDPYRLYSASNAGSLLALVAYPFVIEPIWRVSNQVWLWTGGYALFVALTLAVMLKAYAATSSTDRAGFGSATHDPDTVGAGELGQVEELAWHRRMLWLARAAIASSLLLSVTTTITVDIAPVPLLWLIPLVIYLLTFILAFASARFYPRRAIVFGSIVTIVVSLLFALTLVKIPLFLMLLVPLLTLFFGAMLCHGDMALDRPSPAHLTEFYLWVAVGGVIGGALNSIVAPVVFSGVVEYPLTLIALASVPFWGPKGAGARWRALRPGSLNVVMPLIILVIAGWVVLVGREGTLNMRVASIFTPIMVLIAGLLSLAFRRSWTYLLSIVVVAMFVAGGVSRPFDAVIQARSFFGVLRVQDVNDTRYLVHGSTTHGIQSLDPARRGEPGYVYHPSAPLGALMVDAEADASIGIVGLGAGSLAGLGKSGQTMVYHEIDPLVQEIAEKYFTYLDDSPADVSIVLGDGRLTLAEEPDDAYDIMMLDAFSSDAIPVHLLTVEAFELFRDKVTEDGVIVIHISNRHIDLIQVIRGAASSLGLYGASHDFRPTAEESRESATRSIVAVLSASPEVIDGLIERHSWSRLDPNAPTQVWTDDYAPLLRVIRWRR